MDCFPSCRPALSFGHNEMTSTANRPDTADSIRQAFLEGLAAQQKRSWSDAERHYRKVLELAPLHAEALNNLGVILEDTGHAESAEALYRRALQVKPEYVDATCNLALRLHVEGRRAEAETYYRRAFALKPDCALAYNKLGVLLQESGRLPEAETCFRKAVELMPQYGDAHANLAVLLHQGGRLPQAEACYRESLGMSPGRADVHNNLGTLLQTSGRLEESENCLRAALALNPDYADAHGNLGNLLYAQQRYEEAEACYQAALRLQPDRVETLNNLGRLLHDTGRLHEAEDKLRRALNADPGRLPTQLNLSLVLLAMGRYREGWKLYESRYGQCQHWGADAQYHVRPRLPFPEWQGESLIAKSLLVLSEQGLGDCIQFSRYLPLLKRQGLSMLTVVCPPPLVRLFSDMEGVDCCVPPDAVERLPRHDYATLTMSLPLRLGTTLSSVPSRGAYIRPDRELVAHWRRRLPAGGFKVGLVWAGDPRPGLASANAIDRRRSLHATAYIPLLSIQGIVFVSLQKGETTRRQLLEIPENIRPFDMMDDVGDFADTAAIIEGLDLVISVDTSVVHVAGALDIPVWVLSRFDGCWRWLSERDDSPWYSSLRLFRQPTPGDWAPVLGRVENELRAMVRA
ncbi:tetratricopeptide repeat protein [Paraburkholderia sp. BR14263]|uniref:tetratricopeptide repeat protein n=1 Tax=unclassified Paraburkholderia TaxID=2615204 RepID=UPI0034CD0703